MKNIIYCIITIVLISCDTKQSESKTTKGINQELSEVLKRMKALDQKYRHQLMDIEDMRKRDSIWMLQAKIDRENLKILEDIISEYGFPGRSLVGEDGSRAAFLILQHSSEETMEKHYDLILEAGENNELAMHRAAMFQDRVLMNRGEKQVYRTQIYSKRVIKSETGESYDSAYVWPIEDLRGVNKRRLEVGLNESVEIYAAGFGV
ncbi:hypothetical protein E1176_08705 [Fulvivirga sp. RKSG066]|uniref:DUF6624 domain-containing protein n=1 Tax=Fulvivirga aurantia TaxID=2529383 RepID=UPI0012BBF080|nr:DUF6624 domain-containing protein [Fulvivirga aurantia]MTI21097.1 hypothetical protein [Fulvivirga aurantia]